MIWAVAQYLADAVVWSTFFSIVAVVLLLLAVFIYVITRIMEYSAVKRLMKDKMATKVLTIFGFVFGLPLYRVLLFWGE